MLLLQNYFIIFLQNVYQPLIGFHLDPLLILHFHLPIIIHHISNLQNFL